MRRVVLAPVAAWSADQPQDLGEQSPRNSHFGQLERHITAVAHDLGADLEELVAQRGLSDQCFKLCSSANSA